MSTVAQLDVSITSRDHDLFTKSPSHKSYIRTYVQILEVYYRLHMEALLWEAGDRLHPSPPKALSRIVVTSVFKTNWTFTKNNFYPLL